MYFARTALEQATDETVAAYKSGRFAAGEPVVDLCCGLGGDLLALARRGPALGLERDPVLALLAAANLRAALHADVAAASSVRVADAAETALDGFSAWHADPDRRPAGRRTTKVALHEPGPEAIERWLRACPHGALKLAPAAELPDAWSEQAELEWIGRGGQCRQLVAWFGRLARDPGRRRATIVAADAASYAGHPQAVVRRSILGLAAPLERVAPIARYLYEPDAAVLAADLTAALADEHHLAAIAPGVAYLTGDHRIDDAALSAFEVADVLPYDVRKLRGLLRSRRIGRLEVKKRGVPLDPAQVQRDLAVEGDSAATLLLARIEGRVVAILATRIAHGE
jgi:hypothetical protein